MMRLLLVRTALATTLGIGLHLGALSPALVGPSNLQLVGALSAAIKSVTFRHPRDSALDSAT